MKEQGASLKAAMQPLLQQPGWSVARLSRETGIERGRIYAWWRGDSRPTRASLERVARALDVDADLFPLHDSPEAAHTISGESLVAAAIDRQTAAIEAQTRMLALVLSRLAPSADVPELDELVAQRTYDELQRPRSLPDPARP
jgi:transcriptional regulator with XRE-family HTH domain